MRHVSEARLREISEELRASAKFMRLRLVIGLSPAEILAKCDEMDSIADQLIGDDGPPPFEVIQGGRAA